MTPLKLSSVPSSHLPATQQHRLETSASGRNVPSERSGHQLNPAFECFSIASDIVIRTQPEKPFVNDTMSLYPSLHASLPLSAFTPL